MDQFIYIGIEKQGKIIYAQRFNQEEFQSEYQGVIDNVFDLSSREGGKTVSITREQYENYDFLNSGLKEGGEAGDSKTKVEKKADDIIAEVWGSRINLNSKEKSLLRYFIVWHLTKNEFPKIKIRKNDTDLYKRLISKKIIRIENEGEYYSTATLTDLEKQEAENEIENSQKLSTGGVLATNGFNINNMAVFKEGGLIAKDLQKGEIYEWLSGAEFMDVKYIGRRWESDTKDILDKIGSNIGKGFIFQFVDSGSYVELNPQAVKESIGIKEDNKMEKGGKAGKKTLKKGDSIQIIGRRWFEKSGGNTYHSVDVYVNNELVGRKDFQYGYDDAYKQTGLKILMDNYNMPKGFDEHTPFWKLKEYGINVLTSVSDVARKKDLEKGGAIDSKSAMNYPTERLEVVEQSDDERELELFIDNDGDLYRQRTVPIQTNLITKIAQNKFDINRAPDIFMYLINDGQKKYIKEFGDSEHFRTLTKEQKLNLAKEYTNRFLDEASYGNYNNYLPKKYQMADGGEIKSKEIYWLITGYSI